MTNPLRYHRVSQIPAAEEQDLQADSVSNEIKAVSGVREATLSEYDGTLVGACIVLTAADLRELGVDPCESQSVLYWVDSTEGQVIFKALTQ